MTQTIIQAYSLFLISTFLISSVSAQKNSCGFNPKKCTQFEATSGDKFDESEFFCSPSTEYQIGITNDGDFCICNDHGEFWCAGTCCEGDNVQLRMQKDGHLLVDNPDRNKALWKSKTAGNPTAIVTLSNDGIAEINNADGDLLWTTLGEIDGFVNALHIQKPPTAGNFPARSPAKESDLPELVVSGIDESLLDLGELHEDKTLGELIELQEPDKSDGNEEELDESEEVEETDELHENKEPVQLDEDKVLDEIVIGKEPDVSEEFEESEAFEELVKSDENEETVEVNEGDDSNELKAIGELDDSEEKDEIEQSNELDESEEDEVLEESELFQELEDFLENEIVMKVNENQEFDALVESEEIEESHEIGVVTQVGEDEKLEEFEDESITEETAFSQVDDFIFNENSEERSDLLQPPPTPVEVEVDINDSILSSTIYVPGLLQVNENGLILSKGLKSRIIAEAGKPVLYHNGAVSPTLFHVLPDAGAAFPAPDGGFVYVSNSENRTEGEGGVGAIRFDENGNVFDYKMLLTNTTANCGGGKTPWNTWVSCEENGSRGQIYEVDPFGNHPPVLTAMGGSGGNFESVACDNRNPDLPICYVTNDQPNGEIRQFTPNEDAVKSGDTWDILSTPGTLNYLKFNTDDKTFTWVKRRQEGRESASENFRNCEGIDFRDGYLYFVSKKMDKLYILDIDKGTYKIDKIGSGMFDGAPDQIKRLTSSDQSDLLYFTEEGGSKAGIHARDHQNKYFTIVEGLMYGKETTGLAFSPDGKTLLFAHQAEGVVFAINRLDGEPFHGTSIDVKRHLAGGRRLIES